ncbi:class I SAM-dependent methyltransferase [Tissierella praeacuta]|uniref:class I SAM-dependent methyltransferase n=1 Tax=Tissierella praeacuta TaxID=43131 RepID=UPI0033420FA3
MNFECKAGFDTYGFDGSISAVEKTKVRLYEENLKGTISVADASNTGYKDSYFDAIIDVQLYMLIVQTILN